MTADEMGQQLGFLLRNNPQMVTKQIADLMNQFKLAVQAGNTALYQQIYQQIYNLVASQSANRNVWQSMWQSIQPFAAQAFAFVGLAWSSFSGLVSSMMAEIIGVFLAPEFFVFMLCVMVLVLLYYLLIHVPNRRMQQLQQTQISKIRTAFLDPNYGPVVGIQTKSMPSNIKVEFA